MKPFDFKSAKYSVSGFGGLKLDETLRLWKAKFPTVEHFRRTVTKDFSALKELEDYVEEVWEDIVPVTAKEAFSQKNAEKRRAYFDCIGVVNLFKSVEPKLLDKKVVKKSRKRWDDKNDPYEYVFEDVYELYSIDPKKLYENSDAESSWGFSRSSEKYIAVRCWCTTTKREYWIYVPEEAALASGSILDIDESKKKYDAIKAIAWTIRIDVSNPEKIYRQGDIIIVKESSKSEKVSPYHLGKDDYLKLMYSET